MLVIVIRPGRYSYRVKIINIFLDIGIPFPLPFFTNKKLKLYMFKSINTKKIDDFRDLRRIIIRRVGDLK